ncbi:hypothetical protein SAMN05421783_1356 [Thiocapsa roseopersicina]|uniref:Uncharacterized protein n=1 Tax=Thiocapsa roseopersicina TaxID=1058 RepID=A0A1H3CLF6_THIRO|nr:hypothetical protein SAMN05421783_1356 [Thiocapsa roseopersicina]
MNVAPAAIGLARASRIDRALRRRPRALASLFIPTPPRLSLRVSIRPFTAPTGTLARTGPLCEHRRKLCISVRASPDALPRPPRCGATAPRRHPEGSPSGIADRQRPFFLRFRAFELAIQFQRLPTRLCRFDLCRGFGHELPPFPRSPTPVPARAPVRSFYVCGCAPRFSEKFMKKGNQTPWGHATTSTPAGSSSPTAAGAVMRIVPLALLSLAGRT